MIIQELLPPQPQPSFERKEFPFPQQLKRRIRMIIQEQLLLLPQLPVGKKLPPPQPLSQPQPQLLAVKSLIIEPPKDIYNTMICGMGCHCY